MQAPGASIGIYTRHTFLLHSEKRAALFCVWLMNVYSKFRAVGARVISR